MTEKQKTIQHGYKWFTGAILDNVTVDRYNIFGSEIDRTRNPDTKNFLKNQRHRFISDALKVVCGIG